MHPLRTCGAHRRSALLQRLTVVAAAILAGLLACGALLAALGGPVPSAQAAPASAPVPYPGGAGCTTTLQACIDNSPTGATILIQPNTYYTNGLTLNHAVSLTGVSSATVILHALSNQRVLTVTGAALDSSVIISGLTFAGGHAVGVTCPAGCGGAIEVNGTAQPLLINLTITNNTADDLGGGIGGGVGSPLVLSGVAVLSNTSTTGGGGVSAAGNVTLNGGLFENNRCSAAFCLGAGLNAAGDLAMSGTHFLSNTSTDDGGAALVNGTVTLNGGMFQNNRCTAAGCSGGGLYAGNTLTATNTQFLSNTSAGDGGGVWTFGMVILNGDVFQNNRCTAAGCSGGGLLAGTNLTATDTLFIGNTAQRGAGLYHASADGRLVNDLFAANTARGGQGDAAYLASPGAVNLLFTTIASPTVGSGSAVYGAAGTVGITDTLIASYTVGIETAGATVQEDYNLFSGVGLPLSPTVSLGPHSLAGPANFVNPPANDYHLAPGSAAIDVGVNAGIFVDIDGDPRPLGNGFDIGYDEFNIWRLFLPLVRR